MSSLDMSTLGIASLGGSSLGGSTLGGSSLGGSSLGGSRLAKAIFGVTSRPPAGAAGVAVSTGTADLSLILSCCPMENPQSAREADGKPWRLPIGYDFVDYGRADGFWGLVSRFRSKSGDVAFLMRRLRRR